MRARMALIFCDIQCEVREVLLSHKPQSLLDTSPKGTVPVLVLDSDEVIEESYDIMLWAFSKRSDLSLHFDESADASKMIHDLDFIFKKRLDDYKYSNGRGLPVSFQEPKECLDFFQKWNSCLAKSTYLRKEVLTQVDLAVFPFVRQFVRVDESYFKSLPFSRLQSWYNKLLHSDLFQKAMQKYQIWTEQSDEKYWLI